MAVIQSHLSTQHTDPLRNFKYLVNIFHKVTLDGKKGGTVQTINMTLGFTSVSGLSASTNSIPYRSGGLNTTTQMIPGQTTFTPITLQRGLLLGTKQNWSWFQQLFAVQVGTGDYVSNNSKGFRGNIHIYVLPHPRTDKTNLQPVAQFRVYNAWPTAISYSDMNAGDNAFIVEQVTLAHEGWELFHLATHAFGSNLAT